MTGDDPLFTPIELGEIRCANRVVMAPMTRSRASPGDRVSDLHVEYYGARPVCTMRRRSRPGAPSPIVYTPPARASSCS